MKALHATALSIAALVAVWVWVSVGNPAWNLNPWVGFVAWAAFFAAGGGKPGAINASAAGLAGVVLTALTMTAVAAMGGGLWWLIGLVAILAFVLVAMADVPILAYTPAAFLGAACYFGAGGKPEQTALFVGGSWMLGVGLGFASAWLGQKLTRAEPQAAAA